MSPAPVKWYSTPGGVMRLVGPARSAEPASTFIDRDQKFRTYHDSRCKPTRPPTWWKREEAGEKLLEARRRRPKERNQ